MTGKIFENKGLRNLTITDFINVTFPLIGRIFTRLLANDIVTVQPMGAPQGILHYRNIDIVITPNYEHLNILNRMPMTFYCLQKI